MLSNPNCNVLFGAEVGVNGPMLVAPPLFKVGEFQNYI